MVNYNQLPMGMIFLNFSTVILSYIYKIQHYTNSKSHTNTPYKNNYSAFSRALILSRSGGCEKCQVEYSQSFTGKPRLSLFSLIRAVFSGSVYLSFLAKLSAWNSNILDKTVTQKERTWKKKGFISYESQ